MTFFFVICFLIALLTVNQFAMRLHLCYPGTDQCPGAVHESELHIVPSWLPYSSSSGTGVQDLSGLKRSIFINSLKLANPKSFS